MTEKQRRQIAAVQQNVINFAAGLGLNVTTRLPDPNRIMITSLPGVADAMQISYTLGEDCPMEGVYSTNSHAVVLHDSPQRSSTMFVATHEHVHAAGTEISLSIESQDPDGSEGQEIVNIKEHTGFEDPSVLTPLH